MPGTASDLSGLLELEIAFIFREIFDVSAQPKTIAAYSHFHTVYGASLLSRQGLNMAIVLRERLDLEAIELFLRKQHPGNLLTCKVWACAYLYEAQEGLAPRGRIHAPLGRGTSPFQCLMILCWHGFRSAWKWLKGGLQVYWYRLL